MAVPEPLLDDDSQLKANMTAVTRHYRTTVRRQRPWRLVTSRRRADLVQTLQADPGTYSLEEINDMVGRFHKGGLIRSVRGPYSTVTIR